MIHISSIFGNNRFSWCWQNPRDAFWGESRSPNMVPFHMLGMVSY